MTISLESQRHRSRRLADAPSIPTIPSDARAFRRFLFRSHTRRSQEGITTAESGFKCQHIRPYSGCLYRWPEYLFRFRIATISSYIRVTDGFHTVTVRRTNGQIYYQQTIAFVSGERLTMVILDTVSGVSLTRVSRHGLYERSVRLRLPPCREHVLRGIQLRCADLQQPDSICGGRIQGSDEL